MASMSSFGAVPQFSADYTSIMNRMFCLLHGFGFGLPGGQRRARGLLRICRTKRRRIDKAGVFFGGALGTCLSRALRTGEGESDGCSAFAA